MIVGPKTSWSPTLIIEVNVSSYESELCTHICVRGIECHLILRFSYLTIFSTVFTFSTNLSHHFYIGPSHEIKEWTILIFVIFGYFCNDNRTKFSKQKSWLLPKINNRLLFRPIKTLNYITLTVSMIFGLFIGIIMVMLINRSIGYHSL